MRIFVRPIVKAITSEIGKAYSGPAVDLHFAFIDAELGKRPYFADDTFTAADIQMHYPVEAGLARGAGKRPNIEAWRDRVTQRDAFKRAHDTGGRAIP